MDTVVFTWRELIFVIVLVLAVYIAEMILLIRSNRRPSLSALWRRGSESGRLGKEIERLNMHLEELQERIDDLQDELAKIKAVQPPPSVYPQAIQMAQAGRTPSQVAEACGISLSEADLIVALHRKEAS
ncbi:MAG: DUF2802 domain-containing protein [Sulfuricellaceae bacterium]|nr:DUF2802 domain-containing protein [Sulfuricellaceae bacterium]